MTRVGLIHCALVLCLLTWQAHAITFFLKEGTKKCFIEDVPRDTLVIAAFRCSDLRPGDHAPFDAQPRQNLEEALGVVVTAVRTDSGETIHHQVYGDAGRVAFTSREAGEHEVCFSSNSSRWFGVGTVRFDLELVTGAEGTDYDEVRQMEQLSDLETFVRRLNDRVADVRRAQAYFNSREQDFRDESESVNARVMWYSFIQTIILLASGVWQVNHLKTFFRAKKIV